MYARIPKRVRNDALCLVLRHCENLQRKFVAIQKSTVLHVQGDSSVVALPLNDSLESHSEWSLSIYCGKRGIHINIVTVIAND